MICATEVLKSGYVRQYTVKGRTRVPFIEKGVL